MTSSTSSTVAFQRETWTQFYFDARPLFPIHWEEMALNKESIKLALDIEKYRTLDDADMLHIVTARAGDRLVGYYIAFIMPHPHYITAGPMAVTDIYFMLPEFRQGLNGVRLFQEAERTLRERGAIKAYISCKIHHDLTPLFERLGWEFSDKMFIKMLDK